MQLTKYNVFLGSSHYSYLQRKAQLIVSKGDEPGFVPVSLDVAKRKKN